MIPVFEGEETIAKDNKFVGYLTMKVNAFAPRTQIEVTFHIDTNGILNVTAVEELTGKVFKITTNNYKYWVSKVEFELMVKGS
jgi:molecular chaperone DnaK